MRWNGRYILLCASFLAMAFLTVWLSQRRLTPAPASLPLDDWDIPQLSAHLNRAGVELHAAPIQKNGVIGSSAFLTAVKKDWSDLNDLNKDPRRIHEWRGVVSCTRETPSTAANLLRQWGDRGLLVGPFIFYGDAELLARIGAVLNHARDQPRAGALRP